MISKNIFIFHYFYKQSSPGRNLKNTDTLGKTQKEELQKSPEIAGTLT